MPPFPVGTKIRPIAAFEHHGYEARRTYTVVHVDPTDSTLRARDKDGNDGGWIRWNDCTRADEIGWEWLKTVLPPESVDLLSRFDGLEALQLKEQVQTALVLKIPDLKERILEFGEGDDGVSLSAPALSGTPDDDFEDLDEWDPLLD